MRESEFDFGENVECKILVYFKPITGINEISFRGVLNRIPVSWQQDVLKYKYLKGWLSRLIARIMLVNVLKLKRESEFSDFTSFSGKPSLPQSD